MIELLQLVPLRPEVQAVLETRYRVHGMGDLDRVASRIRGCITNGHSGPSPDVMDQLPGLEIIASASVGYDGIPVDYARSRGVWVTNTPNVLNEDVADLAIALMIMTARRLVSSDRYVRSGKWVAQGDYPLTSRASGKRVGLVGMGRIGAEIAKRSLAMNNSVSYHCRRPVKGLALKHYADLAEMAENSNFLIVAVPLTVETQGIVSDAVLRALGPDGILINVARGPVVDEGALVKALTDGSLGGAGLDVFTHEPRVPEALFEMENVVLQPHVGSATHETRRAMSQMVLDNLDAHFSGKPLISAIGL